MAFPVCALLGVLAAVASGESRPTLKFAGSAPATVAIEEAFKMSLDNLIDINSIPYDPGKWNDTGLLETETDSRFLRAAPAYGDNPWVHDGAYNTWSAMNLLEANDGRATRVARNTLWACCDMEDGKPVVNIRESAHSEWYMYQLWNIAAWHYYLVTGDAGFLAKAYEAAAKILAKQEAGHFNADYGLFEGSFFVGDGISGYPEPPFDPDRHSSNALDYPEVHKALVLSANCVYVGAYRATAAMAKQLGRPQREIDQLTSKAESVAAAINKHLWMPEQKRYGYFIHGTGTRKAGTLDPSQEGGGLSFAILYGVADAERTKLILANVHRQPKGITMTWPHFARFSDERPGRQNVSVWPQINGLFAQAACIGGRTDLFQSEVENLAGLFRGSGKIREIYHHITGEHCGGFQMNSTGKITPWQAVGNQAWGAGAFCRMIFYGLFGMDFETGGIRFAPTLPAAWGEVRLGDLRYKDMTLTVTLKGEGNAIRSFEINGKSATEPFVSGHLNGEQHVTILLGQRPEPRTPPITSPAVIPAEPSGDYYDYKNTMKPERPWLVDWHQRFVYRIMLAVRGGLGDKTAAPEILAQRPPEHAIVGGDGKMHQKFLTYEQALEVIKKVHDLTCGIPQVVMLTGWQYEGHDSKYPAWGAASKHLKRDCDATAEESLRWLMREARKYNCLVALHINMFDAYEDSPLFQEYLEKDIIAKDKNGKPIVGNRWWGMDCYHVSYTQEWKLGLAQKRIDDLIAMVPEIRDHHCIYIDAFLGARKDGQEAPISPYLGYRKEEEARTQRKIFRYWRDRGIDVSSEHVVGLRVDRFVGLQPYSCSQSKLIADLPSALYTTSPYQPQFYKVEPEKSFCEGFFLRTLPYYYKNHPAGNRDFRGMIQGTDICMPALWTSEPTLIAYSKDGCKDKRWKLPDGWRDVRKVHVAGITDTNATRSVDVSDGAIILSSGPDQAVKITKGVK